MCVPYQIMTSNWILCYISTKNSITCYSLYGTPRMDRNAIQGCHVYYFSCLKKKISPVEY